MLNSIFFQILCRKVINIHSFFCNKLYTNMDKVVNNLCISHLSSPLWSYIGHSITQISFIVILLKVCWTRSLVSLSLSLDSFYPNLLPSPSPVLCRSQYVTYGNFSRFWCTLYLSVKTTDNNIPEFYLTDFNWHVRNWNTEILHPPQSEVHSTSSRVR